MSKGSGERPEDEYAQAASVDDLPHFVLRQIAADLNPSDRPIAAHILTNLNDDGLLTVPVVEIARYHHVLISQVEAVLHLIQRAEPLGVGSPSPQAALLAQLEALSESSSVPAQAETAIREGMELLSRHRYLELGHLLGVSTKEAREIAAFIRTNLNPFPGRGHWGERGSSAGDPGTRALVYHYPDVIISRMNEGDETLLVVEIALPISGTLRVNPLFKQALHDAPSEKAEQWRSDLEQAELLVKCLQQRNHTLVRLMQRLTTLQREFILHGNAHMQPITRAYLSKELGVHESTISRAVSCKSVQLPNGHIVPMDVFFDRSLHIRTALRKIIDEETRALSDTEIGEILAQQGFSVARRTVAKYRSMEGILPAHLRNSGRRVASQTYILTPCR
ncbi:MAG: hypothetical protein EHM70_06470 [Chloroflexota bacterium]|nr:MAG: hypothetical protein EHM70_06470 [Chloroflexota bacterium]